MVTLNDILKTNIFQGCKVVAGVKKLNKPIKSASILETMEFKNYVIPESIALTTMYLIKDDLEMFKELINVLHEKNCPGIVIKLGKYINEIPIPIINLANSLDVTIITIDYDMNLSLLVNAIVSEIQKSEFSENSFSSLYTQIAKKIDKNPTTDELVKSAESIKDLNILVHNVFTKKTRFSNNKIKELFDLHYHETDTVIQDGDDILLIVDVKYEETVIYKIAFLTKQSKRYLIYHYAEVYKMMAIIVFQRKQENIMKQDQFLLNFVSNITSNFTTNLELINASKFYNWNINYPLLIFVIYIKGHNLIRPALTAQLKKIISNTFFIDLEQFRFIFLNDLILFISNTSYSANNYEIISTLYNSIQTTSKPKELKIAYSNPISYAQEIPNVFSILSEALQNKKGKLNSVNILNENYVRLISLLKTLDYDKVKDFTISILSNLIDYEKKTSLPLLETLYTYIQCKFSTKRASEILCIHPNSLKYRLTLIENLGYKINDYKSDYFDIYLALYIYLNMIESH